MLCEGEPNPNPNPNPDPDPDPNPNPKPNPNPNPNQVAFTLAAGAALLAASTVVGARLAEARVSYDYSG